VGQDREDGQGVGAPVSAHRFREPTRAAAGEMPPAPAPLVPLAPVDPALAERHRDELERDGRVERRLTWRELGCLLLVAVFVLVRRRYLT
jgi:hypothetical protein